MASASTDPVAADAATRELEAELRRSERRREADERRLEDAKRGRSPSHRGGLWATLTAWF
ncbi:hypothetical protein BRC85_08510 [Halobacteriales archaeon QS_1_69_70]|nr:MAG: hypothetical protein BRC85_08510 [Halobacteriales archaeon QS_1_69_70]